MPYVAEIGSLASAAAAARGAAAAIVQVEKPSFAVLEKTVVYRVD